MKKILLALALALLPALAFAQSGVLPGSRPHLPTGSGCLYWLTPPAGGVALSNGMASPLQCDNKGSLLISGSGSTGSTVPPNAILNGLSDGTNLRAWLNAANALNSTGTGIGTAQVVGQCDDTSPTALTENQFGNVRMDCTDHSLLGGGNVTTAAPTYSTGTARSFSLTTGGALRMDTASIAGTAVATTAGGSGVQKVGIVGNAGAIFDGATGAAVPANVLYIGLSDGTNLRGWLNAANSLNSTGAGIGTAQIVGQCDDTSPTGLTENQFGNVRMDCTDHSLLTGAAVLTSVPTYTTATARPLTQTTAGSLRVDLNSIIGTTAVAASAGILKVGIVGNGGSAAIFDGAIGAAPAANVMQMGTTTSGATGGLLTNPKTCDTHAKYDASDNGSITMVTGVSGRKVYICGFIMATGGTATNLKLREGSDANCATNAADLTPAYQLIANDRVGALSTFWTGLVVSTNAYFVCVNASAGNAHQAELWYTIQ